MDYQLLALVVVTVIVLLLLIQKGRKTIRKRNDRCALHEQISAAEGCYVFLIDKKLDVLDTNYYELNPERRHQLPYGLGNVLCCQQGEDCGECGMGFACKTCPVRHVITNAFKQKHDFNDVSATMTLYSIANVPESVNVRLMGKRVYVGDEPHMLVTVVESETE